MRHRSQVYPALVNNLFLVGVAAVVTLLVVVFCLFFIYGRRLEDGDWAVLLAVFGGAIALSAPLATLSELTKWFKVGAPGITCRTTRGIGVASTFMRETIELPWEDIAQVRPSKYMPYGQITLTVKSQRGARSVHDYISIPLYLRRPDKFAQAILTHAPDGHPIRRFFASRPGLA